MTVPVVLDHWAQTNESVHDEVGYLSCNEIIKIDSMFMQNCRYIIDSQWQAQCIR